MMVCTCAVRSREAAIQYRKGTGTETTHWRVGTQGMTCSTRCAAVWAMRRPAQDGQKPRRLQLKGTSSSDRKSTRLNSSHVRISYAVFCLKKKKKNVKRNNIKKKKKKKLN